MRLFPLIAAVCVGFALYLYIFQRDAVDAYLEENGTGDATESAEATNIEEAPGSGLVRVVVRRSEAREIDSAVILRGQTRAARQVDVKSETSARVISEPLRKGARVEEGEALCRLDEGNRGAALAQSKAQLEEARARVPEAQARVEQARAQLDEARINQNASARLSEGGFASTTRVAGADAAVASALASVESARAGLQAAQSGIRSAQAAVASAETEIARLVIRAPFSGLLESDTAELGSLLQPGALCSTIIQLDPIKLVAFVPETEVSRIRAGAQAVARLVTGAGSAGTAPLTGQVTFLSRSADEQTRTFLVEIEVPNADLAIRDGQTAEILISADGAKAHLLPQSALTLNDEGVLGLRTIDADALVEFHPVEIMRDTPEGVWLTGLDDTADVIVLGQEYVIAGVTVAPTWQELSQ